MPIENLPEEYWIEKNKLDQGAAWVWLLDITLTDDTTFHFVNNPTAIKYPEGQSGEVEYTPLDFAIGNLEDKKGGNLERTISITNEKLVGTLLPYFKDYKGLVGSTVILTPLNTDFPDIDYSSKAEEYEVMSSTIMEKRIDVRLGTVNPLMDSIPSQTYFGKFCRYCKYFKQPPCNYSGEETSCDGTLKRCKELGNEARWGGFICLTPKAVRFC